jgi:outer membrane protein TolC
MNTIAASAARLPKTVTGSSFGPTWQGPWPSTALRGLGAASAEIAATRDRAVRDVWRAYAMLTTALRQRAVVAALLAASDASYEQSIVAYRNGLATFVEVDEARRGLADAQLADYESAANVRMALSRLALSTGELLREPDPELPARN